MGNLYQHNLHRSKIHEIRMLLLLIGKENNIFTFLFQFFQFFFFSQSFYWMIAVLFLGTECIWDHLVNVLERPPSEAWTRALRWCQWRKWKRSLEGAFFFRKLYKYSTEVFLTSSALYCHLALPRNFFGVFLLAAWIFSKKRKLFCLASYFCLFLFCLGVVIRGFLQWIVLPVYLPSWK